MKFFALILLALIVSTPLMAKQITAEVNGLVCDFCAQSLTKVFMKEPGVEKLDVSLENKTVTIHLNDNATITDEKINELISWGGYDVVKIQR
jgi:copper chaperone CopZ